MVTIWEAEPWITRGGQHHYSSLAIATALMLRSVYRLALHYAEGLIGSIIALPGLDLAVPDHTTLMWTALGRQRLSVMSSLSQSICLILASAGRRR